jgi:hypothetical protein
LGIPGTSPPSGHLLTAWILFEHPCSRSVLVGFSCVTVLPHHGLICSVLSQPVHCAWGFSDHESPVRTIKLTQSHKVVSGLHQMLIRQRNKCADSATWTDKVQLLSWSFKCGWLYCNRIPVRKPKQYPTFERSNVYRRAQRWMLPLR